MTSITSTSPRRAILRSASLLLAAGIVFFGCSTSQPIAPQESSALGGAVAGAGPERAETSASASSVTGFWEGTSLASCAPGFTTPGRCGAQQRITLNLIQNGSQISGGYHCEFGNMVCRNLNQEGKIISGTYFPGRASFRVAMPDGSTCLFSGRFSNRIGNGGYTCTSGGTILEQGNWSVARQF